MATIEAPPQQAMLFGDTAPSWEELQAMVEAKQQALDAVPPSLETVRRRRRRSRGLARLRLSATLAGQPATCA